MGKSKSVSSREIHRNKDLRSGEYKPDPAQKKYRQREDEKKKHIRFTDSIKSDVQPLIEEDYSYEQIVGTLEKRGIATVSHERIYQHIRADKKQKGLLHTHLRRQGRHDRKRGSRKDSRGIIRDRGDKVTECLWLLFKLDMQAEKQVKMSIYSGGIMR